MSAEEMAAQLVQSMPGDIEGIESARDAVLGDTDAYRTFENGFYNSVPAEFSTDEERLRAGIGRFLLGQDSKAMEALAGLKDVAACFIRARLYGSYGQWTVALSELETVLAADPRSPSALLLKAECHAQLGDLEALAPVVDQLVALIPDAPAAAYVRGLVQEVEGNYEEATQQYNQALAVDANFTRAMFRLAYGESLRGETETAIELYEKICHLRPIPTGALLNLGLLFEDAEDYQLAATCFQRVLDFDPNNHRARLYFRDAVASTSMFYDEEKERKEDKRAQVLRIPVTDFELSVRSRNCLANMNVRTLGDLIRLSEQELLAFKNFGETSLQEIKHILTQKGLRLGMLPREEQSVGLPIPAAPVDRDSALTRPVNDLDLSVRSRKALDTLSVRTVEDLINTPESRLLACKNFGHTSLMEIKKKLSDMGLSLRNT